MKMTHKTEMRGTWVAQSVKRPTLDFGSGHDLRILGSSPVLGGVVSTLSGESAWDSFLFPLPLLLPPLALFLSLSLSNK